MTYRIYVSIWDRQDWKVFQDISGISTIHKTFEASKVKMRHYLGDEGGALTKIWVASQSEIVNLPNACWSFLKLIFEALYFINSNKLFIYLNLRSSTYQPKYQSRISFQKSKPFTSSAKNLIKDVLAFNLTS